ncbi:hypothetical protein RL72_01761 [Microbacterium azadirachtae]|uniref:Uncharacterized protein n=1 Tax=Microbacterium azadirachtae TaxID=582680 RepID=A0A0F0KW10_9MICO|nr:hypothetical protein RL72_01761 [Microbacterium azadirachtae]
MIANPLRARTIPPMTVVIIPSRSAIVVPVKPLVERRSLSVWSYVSTVSLNVRARGSAGGDCGDEGGGGRED